VGGAHLAAVLEVMNSFGRISACGAISQYNALEGERQGVDNLFNVVVKRLKMQVGRRACPRIPDPACIIPRMGSSMELTPAAGAAS
jgi:hypothetical protein